MTYLEEHEITPTYELYFTGCSLRCRFCTVPEAIYQPEVGEWLEPEALVESMAAPEVPPFRSVSFVGGDPTVNLPYLRRLAPLIRARLPTVELVLNTNLFVSPHLLPELAETYDWIVGDVHFWQPECAGRLAGARSYPPAAVAAAEGLLAAGARLILRVLVLPGHHDCCAAPTVEWARGLDGDLRVHVMTHYAPAGRARGHAELGRPLSPAEVALAEGLRAGLPGLAAAPIEVPARGGSVDAEAPLEVAPDGRVLAPFATGDVLRLLAEADPKVKARLVYLE